MAACRPFAGGSCGRARYSQRADRCEDVLCALRMLCCRADDVQVELVMLDPWVRATLKHNNEVCKGWGSGGL